MESTLSTTLNMFDLIFVVSGLIFVLVAFFRGFIKEIFSLFVWVISISLSYFLSPYMAKFIESYSHNKVIANIISSTILFVLIFIASTLATRQLCESSKEKISTTADQILGVIYGIFKTFLVFGLIFSVTINAYALILGDLAKGKTKLQIMPSWLREAKTRPYIQPVASILDPIVIKIIFGVTSKEVSKNVEFKKKENDQESLGQDDEEGAVMKKKSDSSKKIEEESDAQIDEIKEERYGKEKFGRKNKEKGYTKKDIQKMDRLIEIVE